MRLFGRQVMPEPDLEGYHSFPSIYHLHLHLIKGKPTRDDSHQRFEPTADPHKLFRRPPPVQANLCHLAAAEMVEKLLENGMDLGALRKPHKELAKLHPLDPHVPASATHFVAQECPVKQGLTVTLANHPTDAKMLIENVTKRRAASNDDGDD